MVFTKELYEKALKIIGERRERAEAEAKKREREFERIVPEYTDLKNKMITSVRDTFKVLDMEPEKAKYFLEGLKKTNLEAQEERRELFKKYGMPDDCFEPRYTCSLCKDTGYSDSRLCVCCIEILKRLACEQAGKSSPLKFCRFEDFRLDYYSDEYSDEYRCSPRERMRQIFDFCRNYAESFDSASPNILMSGKTGLGKTHLSLAIAREVIKNGGNVIYNSAQNMFDILNREYFSRVPETGYENMIKECDLLVLDDLGAEFSTQFTVAMFGELINTRINYGLPTIISTNLELKELEGRYTPRVSSRIIGEFSHLCFIGADIRQIKAPENGTAEG